MTLLLMVANVQNRDDKLGFSDTATDVLALDIVPNEKPFYKKCHVKVLNIGDTSEFCVLNEFCAGDGGAPMVCSYEGDNDEKFVLEGVNSWGLSKGRQCVFGDDGKPSVFARIRNHLKWVDEEYNKSLAKDGKVNF